MSRQKIDYGIDLGTTNSCIARVDNGNVRVFQIGNSLVLPSCVYFITKSNMFVGQKAYNRLPRPGEKNTFAEFKKMMGTDHSDYSSNSGASYTPEELSGEVLKELTKWVIDEEFRAAIITVPAAFDQTQIEATQRATELAGFEYCELLQEPIAASLAYLNDEKNLDGVWFVFDLGGGTFDAALVKMEDGIMTVIDHAGDNSLGGSNMDWLIVDDIIVPYLADNFAIQGMLNDKNRKEELLRAWKPCAEDAKIALSNKTSYDIVPTEPLWKDDNGKEIDPVININRSELEILISPLIDRALKISSDLIAKNRLSSRDLLTVLMVGGPTYMPVLRERVKTELCENINISIDPLTVVAKGAALFASTRPMPVEHQKRDYSKIQLTLAYPNTTAETEIPLGIKIEKEKTSGRVPSEVFAEITRKDGGWTSGSIELEGGVAFVRLLLVEKTTNNFSVQLFDKRKNRVECEPDSISILQGVKIAQPPLPHDIGLSAIVTKESYEELMVPILTKGTPLPAVKEKTFIAPKNLRPGNKSDELKIIVWEGRGGSKPITNRRIGEIKITGEKLPSLLPKGSEVEVTMRLDESRRVKVTAYMPYLDETIEGVLDSEYMRTVVSSEDLSHEIDAQRERIPDIEGKMVDVDNFDWSELEESDNELVDLGQLNEKGSGDASRSLEVQNRLNEIAAKLDEIERRIKWPLVENELNEAFESTEQVVERYGNDRDEQILTRLRPEVEKVIELTNNKRANNVMDKLNELKWSILFQQHEYWISVLNGISQSFDDIPWSDSSEAKSLVNRGSELLDEWRASGQYSDELEDIVRSLWGLMPESGRVQTREPRTDILHY